MGRFSPTVVGRYTKPNYLEEALSGIGDVVGNAIREGRAANARTAELASTQAFQRSMQDDRLKAQAVRDAELDSRYLAETQRAEKRNALELALQGIVPSDQAPTRAPVVGMDGGLARPAKVYNPLPGTGYSVDASRTPEGIQALSEARNRTKVGEIAGLLDPTDPGQQSLAQRIRGLSDPALATSLVGPAIRGPMDDARELRLYGQKERIAHSYDRPPERAPVMIGGLPYTFSGGRVTPVTLPNGEPVPVTPKSKALPSSIVEDLATMSAADQAIDDVLADPKAFTHSFVGQAFGGVNAMVPDKVLNYMKPGSVGSRATLAGATSAIRAAISGKTVSQGEAATLAPFIPTNGDTPEAVKVKLREVKKFIARKSAALRSGGAIPDPGVDSDQIDPDILQALGGH